MSDDLYARLEQTAVAHVRAFESPSPFDPNEIYQYRTPDCVIFFHPENSMPAPFGNGARVTRAEYEPAIRQLGAVTERLKFDIREVSVDVTKHIVTVRMQGIFDFKAVSDDPPVKDWIIEYIWITAHDESSGLIVRMEESLDLVQVLPMLDKAARYHAEQQQRQ